MKALSDLATAYSQAAPQVRPRKPLYLLQLYHIRGDMYMKYLTIFQFHRTFIHATTLLHLAQSR